MHDIENIKHNILKEYGGNGIVSSATLEDMEWCVDYLFDKGYLRQWQPIESAPHGEIVLLWSKEKGIETAYASWGERIFNPAIGQVVSNKWHHGQATHWMPLPEPPEGFLK